MNQYAYDPLQRLVNSNVTSGQTKTLTSFQYDSVGNRAQQILNGITTTYSYNVLNNELTSSLTSALTTRYSYDNTGNLVSKTAGNTQWIFAWSPAGNLVSAANNTVTKGLYAYDGLGRRVESIEGGSTLFYGYLGTETLAELRSGLENNYVFAAGLRIAHYGSNPTVFYHADPLGSTRMVTDQDKNIIFSDSYQPYGQDSSTTGSETYKFTGKSLSQTTGLYYEFHRWYDPLTGRFISTDPRQGSLENPQTLNRYAYVADSPLNNNDPSGEFINIVIGAIAGGLIGWTACGLTTGAWFSRGCGEAAAVGVGTGALAGATLGLSLGVMGVAGVASASLPEAVAAGAISGFVSGVASFDLDALFDPAKATWNNFIEDATIGTVSGILGGAIGDFLGGVKAESLDPRNLGSELEQSGAAFVNTVSKDAQDLSQDLGLVSAPTLKISSTVGKILIGSGVELGKGLITGVIDPGLKSLVQVFSSSTTTTQPPAWRDIGNRRG